MKLFTAMEEFAPAMEGYSMEDIDTAYADILEERAITDRLIESFDNAVVANEQLKKLEGLRGTDRRVYDVTMESINDQLGYPEGSVVSSEGIGESISKFAKNVWAKIVAAWRAVRDWVRKLFGMTPIVDEDTFAAEEEAIRKAEEDVRNANRHLLSKPSGKETPKENRDRRRAERRAKSATQSDSNDAIIMGTPPSGEPSGGDADKENRDRRRAERRAKAASQSGSNDAIIMGTPPDSTAAPQSSSIDDVETPVLDDILEKHDKWVKDNPDNAEHNVKEILREIHNEFGAMGKNRVLDNIDKHEFNAKYVVILKTALRINRMNDLDIPSRDVVHVAYGKRVIDALTPYFKDSNEVVTEQNMTLVHDTCFVGPGEGGNNVIDAPRPIKGITTTTKLDGGEGGRDLAAGQACVKRVIGASEFIMDNITDGHFDTHDDKARFGASLKKDADWSADMQVGITKFLKKREALLKLIKLDTNGMSDSDLTKLSSILFGGK